MKYMKYFILIIILLPVNVLAYTIAPVDITKMSIEDINDAFDKGYLTSEFLVNLYLERINEYNKDFNAIKDINESALSEAKEYDHMREEGKIISPLQGIPFVVKNNIDVTFAPTTAGAKALSDNYPSEDADVVKKLKEKGAIVLGTTNMSEFAFMALNSKSSYGNVKNAFNKFASPYGSSGGSAVSVATSFATFALGTDTNSSVRIPASAAGIVGLRPTFDLISREGIIPYDLLRDTVGIMTKNVDDNALVFSAILDKKINTDYNNKIKLGIPKNYLYGTN